jgi:hypothetical protein
LKNLPLMNELFGQNATSTYDGESGSQVRVSGKQVVATFRNDEGKIVVIVNQDGMNRAEVITDNDVKDKVLNRLKGKNLPTFIDAITGYDLSITGGSTGAIGSTGATSSNTTKPKVVVEGSYNPQDSSVTVNFKKTK